MSYELIPGGKRYRDGREVMDLKTVAGRFQYGYRLQLMVDRQHGFCAICMEWMGFPTFEHQDGRGAGGGHRDDRIEIDGRWYNAAICVRCQGKGSVRYHWVDLYFIPRTYATLAEAVAGGHKTDACDGGDAPWLTSR